MKGKEAGEKTFHFPSSLIHFTYPLSFLLHPLQREYKVILPELQKTAVVHFEIICKPNFQFGGRARRTCHAKGVDGISPYMQIQKVSHYSKGTFCQFFYCKTGTF